MNTFRVTTNGTVTTLVNFNNTNGAFPEAPLTLGPDGNFYGTTLEGGGGNYGTVFQMSTNGALTTLINFINTNGVNPQASLTLGSDGYFYGTTSGVNGKVLWNSFPAKVTSNGTLTTLVNFSNTNGATWPP